MSWQGVIEEPFENAEEEHRRSFSTALPRLENFETAPTEDSSHSLLTPTVFHEEWWLEAATQGRYSIAEVCTGGRTLGRLPFLMRKRFGIQGIWTPPLTLFLGPGINEGEGSPNNRFLKRMDIMRELIHKLPRSAWQCIRCHGGITDVIAFQEQRFRTYVQFTHEIHPEPEEVLWNGMRAQTRNSIRRAKEQFVIGEIADVDEFIRLHQKNLASEGERNTLDLEACRRVLTAALHRERGRIIVARNMRNQIVAANFCAWDRKASFYVICTRNESAGNGAASLLIWEAIKHAVRKGLTFDFGGLGTPGSIRLYSGFGATISPRYVAVRASCFARLVAEAKCLFTREYFLF